MEKKKVSRLLQILNEEGFTTSTGKQYIPAKKRAAAKKAASNKKRVAGPTPKTGKAATMALKNFAGTSKPKAKAGSTKMATKPPAKAPAKPPAKSRGPKEGDITLKEGHPFILKEGKWRKLPKGKLDQLG